jgi:MFS family permease
MLYHHLFAFLGVLAGGKIADHLAAARPSVRMEANLVGLLLGAPFIYWLGQAATAGSCYIALALFGLFRGIYDSNLFASLFDVVEPRLRASATGLMLSFAFVIGSLAPTVLGAMKSRVGLATGLSSLAWCYLFGAVCVFVAMKFFLRRDYVQTAAKQVLA